MQMTGHGAIVTGAASGMGRATAVALARAGANVALLDVNAAGVTAAAAAIGGHAIPCDLGDDASTEDAVGRAIAAVGAPRVLISCAGIGRLELFTGPSAVPFAQLFETINVNLIGTLRIAHRVAADLLRRDRLATGERGVFVFVASGAAFDGPVASSAYTAAKGGLVSVTLALARELGDAGIRVNTISPGAFDTAMIRNAPPEMLAMIPKTTPFPKRMGDPAEFAALALHICENVFLNGAVLRLDGANRVGYYSDAV